MVKKKALIIICLVLVLTALSAGLVFNWTYFPDRPFRLGLDLQGGLHLVYQADLKDIDEQDHDTALDGLRNVIERRVNLFGVVEPVVQIEKDSQRLIVELAGIEDPERAREMIGETPFLEFKEQAERDPEERDRILEIQEKAESKDFEEIQEMEDWHLVFEDPDYYFAATPLTGRYLTRARAESDPFMPGRYFISIQFDDEGAKIFEDLTKRNIGKPIAIYLDNEMLSSPVVQEAISGGQAQITGEFTRDEAVELARNLSAGALPVPITLISDQSVGPTLGRVSLEQSLLAGMWGLIAVIVFMIVFYRVPGLLASLALIIYALLILALFKLIPVTITLAGIGGFLLSIGMAIDANILIFSRLREELKDGKSFAVAVEEGFRRAWPSIRDGNLTTLIVAMILFFLGSGFVEGFALTLTIGILISMFSAIVITKNLLRVFAGSKLEGIKILWH